MSQASRSELGIDLRMSGKILRIADTSLYYDSFLDVELEPGIYVIYELRNSEGVTGIAALSSTEEAIAAPVADISFDFAQFALFDREAVDRAFDGLADMQSYYDQLDNRMQHGTIRVHPDVEIPFFRCEAGAGRVSTLRAGERLIGVQVLFVSSEE